MTSKKDLEQLKLLFSDFQMLDSIIGSSDNNLIFPNNLEIRINFKKFRKIYFIRMLEIEDVLSGDIEIKKIKNISEFVACLPDDAQEVIFINQGLITKYLHPEVMHFYLSQGQNVDIEIKL